VGLNELFCSHELGLFCFNGPQLNKTKVQGQFTTSFSSGKEKKKLVIFFCPGLVCSQQDKEYPSTEQLLQQGHHLKIVQATSE